MKLKIVLIFFFSFNAHIVLSQINNISIVCENNKIFLVKSDKRTKSIKVFIIQDLKCNKALIYDYNAPVLLVISKTLSLSHKLNSAGSYKYTKNFESNLKNKKIKEVSQSSISNDKLQRIIKPLKMQEFDFIYLDGISSKELKDFLIN